MSFFGVFPADLDGQAFTAASNDQVATWLFLHGLCFKEMNRGRIDAAHDLEPRYWHRNMIDPAILDRPSPLWTWDGGTLVLECYDIGAEEKCVTYSERAKKAAKARWDKERNRDDASGNASSNAPNPTLPNPTVPNQPDPTNPPSIDLEASREEITAALESIVQGGGGDSFGLGGGSGGGGNKVELIKEAQTRGLSEADAVEAYELADKQRWRTKSGQPIKDFPAWARKLIDARKRKQAQKGGTCL